MGMTTQINDALQKKEPNH